ncbi:TetR/AcrR family transcriptional regulator [Kaistella montana]|uniref:TetR/AcrR family transcriptional regulator n=1 Tax=Kaistella montana TaxID=1849733 RepID=A0ABW5K7G5_9FLAO|nr:TetR/AcrR family transcriptional regulator [Kaistella montana]MCQ4035163.1 TetR family transcriptional regulator [Kaistella montana]
MNQESDITTEEKILISASKVFTEKGFSGTRTRDIAEEAGINLALLNYYFRSKEKLFEQVMKVKIILLFGKIIPIVINEKTTLEEKIDLVSERYFEILSKNPNLPLFILSEIQKKPSNITSLIAVDKLMKTSVLVKQIQEKKPALHPFHFIINFLSMTAFPFIGKPVLKHFNILNDEEFQKFVEERKTLVPVWIKMILNS